MLSGGMYGVLQNWMYAIETQPSTQHLHAHCVLWSACLSDLASRFRRRDFGSFCDMAEEIGKASRSVDESCDLSDDHVLPEDHLFPDDCDVDDYDGLIGVGGDPAPDLVESDSDDSIVADGDDSEYPGLSHLLNSVSDPLDDFDQMAFGVCDDVDETVEFDVGRRRPRKSPQKRRRSVRLVDDEAVADGMTTAMTKVTSLILI